MTGTAESDRTAAHAPAVRVFVLGQFRVIVDGQVLSERAWQRPQSRRLFKYLATRRFRRVPKESAMSLFWPDSEPAATGTNLRSLVFGIRHALHEVGAEQLLVSDRDSLSFASNANIWVDAEAFDEFVARARQVDDPLPLLESASELYRGDFLADDLLEDWAAERRQALRLDWEAVQLQLAQRYEQRGEQEKGLARLLALLLVDRCNERAGQEAMRLLVDLGRRPEALRVFNALQLALQDELGVEPAQRTLELQRLATQTDTPAPLARGQRFRCAYSFPQPRELIGRAGELERMQRLIDRGRTSGQALMLSAPAGTGKSTLLGALVKSAQDRGLLCLVGGSYDQRSAVPLVAFEEALTDYILSLARESIDAELSSAADELIQVNDELRQHLGLDAQPKVDVSNARMRLFGAVLSFVRSMAARGPLLLCLEDLHAADAATLQLLHFLVRQTRHSPVLIIGTFRHEELRPGEPLAQLVSSLEREGIAEHMRLAPLDRQATGKLAALLSDGPISETARKALHELTEGNPLFIEQVMLTLGANGQLDTLVSIGQQIIGQGANVPLVIRELIGRRLADMAPTARATMEIAAVLGSTFDEATLLAVAAPTEEPDLLTHLDEAINAHILRETPNGYAFQHALLREGVYWNLSRPRRTLLHRRAAEVLEQLAGNGVAERATELAYHYNMAGQSLAARGKAFHYSLTAGRQAYALSSHREAMVHFTRASELLESGQIDADATARIEVLAGRSEAEQEVGRWRDSLDTSEQILALCQDPLKRARTRCNMCYAHFELGRLDDMVQDVRDGLEDLHGSVGPESAALRLELLQWSALELFVRGHYQQVLELGQQMLAEAKLLPSTRPLLVSHSVLAWGYSGLGQMNEALEQHQLAMAAAQRDGWKVPLAMMRQNAGLNQYLAGHFSEAESELQHARELFYESANEARALHAMQHQALVWLARGELSRAHAQASLALELSQAGEVRWAADSQHILGLIAALRAQWQDAEGCFQRALHGRREVGALTDEIETCMALGRVYEESGDWPHALELYTESVRRAGELDRSPKLVTAKAHLGRLRLHMGESREPARILEATVELAQTMPDTLEYGPALLTLAELRLHEGHASAARELVERALARELPIEHALNAHCLLARVYATLAEPEQGAEHAHQALGLAQQLGSPHLAATALLASGLVSMARGDLRAALSSFQAGAQQAEVGRAPYQHTRALIGQIQALQQLGEQDTAAALMPALAALQARLGAPRAGLTPTPTGAPT